MKILLGISMILRRYKIIKRYKMCKTKYEEYNVILSNIVENCIFTMVLLWIYSR